MQHPEPYFIPEEAADVLGVTCHWVYVNLRAGRLHGTQKGRNWRIAPEDLETFSRSRQPRGRPRAVCAR
ncbi:MAG: helix-turn-helix domain-containing protein [Gammaproteobacteria bacterium]|nr:helix-turn-helix domain-containing protein [Gammaproteobacteria bacterium]